MKVRISSKMLVGYLLMAGLLLVGGFITVLHTYRLQRVASQVLSDNVTSLKAAQELEVALFRMRGLTLNYIINADPVSLQTLEHRKSEFLAWLDEAKKSANTDDEGQIVDNITTLFADYERTLTNALSVNRVGGARQADALLLDASRELFDDIYQQCESFVAVNENDIYKAVEKIDRAHSIVRAAMYGLALVGLVLGLFLGLVISRNVINPICELVVKVRGATEGELVDQVELTQASEMEELDRHVHELISQINAQSADLQKNRELLAKADRLAALGRVASGVAHEIRNPLTAIKMLIYSIREELASGDDRKQDLDVITKEIDRIDRFVRNFLQYARPPEPKPVALDLRNTIRETLMLMEPRLRQNGIKVVEAYEKDLGRVVADEDQMKQVTMNLLLNALASMPNGGELAVETHKLTLQTDAASEWLQVKFVDSGSGISAELLDSLFEPFVSGREDGIGLGLSVASQIIQGHGGKIEATNNPNRGATFTVNLPFRNGEFT